MVTLYVRNGSFIGGILATGDTKALGLLYLDA